MFIVIANTKGGVGKTVLATSILAKLAENHAVIGVDLDSANKSASEEWSKSRSEEEGKFYYISGEIRDQLSTAIEDYDHVVADVGGFDNEEFRQAIALADVVVIPMLVGTTANILGMRKVAQVIESLRPNNLPKVIGVATRAPNLGSNAELNRLIEEMIQDELVNPSKTTIGDRVWYGRAFDEGKGITEIVGLNAREQKYIDVAVNEFVILFNEILGD